MLNRKQVGARAFSLAGTGFDFLTFCVFSERTTLRSLYAIIRPSVVCCLSSVCDVGAPYSGG